MEDDLNFLKMEDNLIQHKWNIEMPFSSAKDCRIGIYNGKLT